MGRPRKRHVQQELFRSHGGKRKGAGRPPKGPRSSEPHAKRPALKKSEPVHVTVRVVDELAALRQRDAYRAIRRAMLKVFDRDVFHIVAVSIQGSHVHLLVEAQDRTALARGMQAMQISAAKHLNRAFSKRRKERRRGTVFGDRYHAEVITNRRQARHALAYVLNNWRRHGEHRVKELRGFAIDPYSSAISFDGWREPFEVDWPKTYEPLPVWKPRTWLLSQGWQLYGRISVAEIPGPRSRRPRASA
jgi:putative transposase